MYGGVESTHHHHHQPFSKTIRSSRAKKLMSSLHCFVLPQAEPQSTAWHGMELLGWPNMGFERWRRREIGLKIGETKKERKRTMNGQCLCGEIENEVN